MKHAQTQGQETGLASLLDGTTPGPWRVSPRDGWHSFHITANWNEPGNTLRAVVGEVIALPWESLQHHESEANARLIAAAPALAASHAALYSALEQLERVESSPHSETVRYLAREDARKALSDARNLTAGMEGGTR